MRVVFEPLLDWQVWRTPDTIILGRESYHQFIFGFLVEPAILETDPGPLDARVP